MGCASFYRGSDPVITVRGMCVGVECQSYRCSVRLSACNCAVAVLQRLYRLAALGGRSVSCT